MVPRVWIWLTVLSAAAPMATRTHSVKLTLTSARPCPVKTAARVLTMLPALPATVQLGGLAQLVPMVSGGGRAEVGRWSSRWFTSYGSCVLRSFGPSVNAVLVCVI